MVGLGVAWSWNVIDQKFCAVPRTTQVSKILVEEAQRVQVFVSWELDGVSLLLLDLLGSWDRQLFYQPNLGFNPRFGRVWPGACA